MADSEKKTVDDYVEQEFPIKCNGKDFLGHDALKKPVEATVHIHKSPGCSTISSIVKCEYNTGGHGNKCKASHPEVDKLGEGVSCKYAFDIPSALTIGINHWVSGFPEIYVEGIKEELKAVWTHKNLSNRRFGEIIKPKIILRNDYYYFNSISIELTDDSIRKGEPYKVTILVPTAFYKKVKSEVEDFLIEYQKYLSNKERNQKLAVSVEPAKITGGTGQIEYKLERFK